VGKETGRRLLLNAAATCSSVCRSRKDFNAAPKPPPETKFKRRRGIEAGGVIFPLQGEPLAPPASYHSVKCILMPSKKR
jgi:hypothetical protein